MSSFPDAGHQRFVLSGEPFIDSLHPRLLLPPFYLFEPSPGPWPRRAELPALKLRPPPPSSVGPPPRRRYPSCARPGRLAAPPHGPCARHPCPRSPLLPPRRSLAAGQGASSGARPRRRRGEGGSTSRWRGQGSSQGRRRQVLLLPLLLQGRGGRGPQILGRGIDGGVKTACRLDGGCAQACRGWQRGRARGRAAGDRAGGHEGAHRGTRSGGQATARRWRPSGVRIGPAGKGRGDVSCPGRAGEERRPDGGCAGGQRRAARRPAVRRGTHGVASRVACRGRRRCRLRPEPAALQARGSWRLLQRRRRGGGTCGDLWPRWIRRGSPRRQLTLVRGVLDLK